MVLIPPGTGFTEGGLSSTLRPQSPRLGETYVDPYTGRREVWSGDVWVNVAEGDTGAFFGTGRDGSLVVSSSINFDFNSTNILIKEYEDLFIQSGQTIGMANVPDSGALLILRIKRNFRYAGTIDMSGDGATGGTSVTLSSSIQVAAQTSGNPGTNSFNNLTETRNGSGGNTGVVGNSQSCASGGGSGASTVTAGSASDANSGCSCTAASASGGVALTTASNILGGSAVGIVLCPGGGGASGGVALNLSGDASTEFIATSGDGGRGGGAIYITCGGDFIFTGTVILSGAAAGLSSASGESPNASSGAAGGSSGGGSGVGVAIVRGTITDSGTKTVTGGASSAGVIHQRAGGCGSSTSGKTGAAGRFTIVQA